MCYMCISCVYRMSIALMTLSRLAVYPVAKVLALVCFEVSYFSSAPMLEVQ